MCKAEQLIGRLTVSERRSLRALDVTGGQPLPVGHEEKLIELGLAELMGGALGLTHIGRRALALIGEWAPREDRGLATRNAALAVSSAHHPHAIVAKGHQEITIVAGYVVTGVA